MDIESRARTHLANERTFLAWLRTGVTLIALGLAAGQFLAVSGGESGRLVRGLATLLAGSGIGAAVLGAFRYRAGERRIEAGEFQPAGSSILVATAAAVVVGAVAIAFIWLLDR
jgi:putative membrane protein